MSSVTEPPVAASPIDRILELRQAWLRIDKNPAAVAWVRTPIGVVALHLAFVAMLAASTNLSLQRIAVVVLGLTGCLLWPNRRLLVISMTGVLFFLVKPFKRDWTAEQFHVLWQFDGLPGGVAGQFVTTIAAGSFLVLIFAVLRLSLRYQNSAFARRPVLSLLTALTAISLVAVLTPQTSLLHAVAWTLCTFLTSVFFFLAYLLAEQKAGRGVTAYCQIGFLKTLWPATFTPIKGPGFLQKFEAKDADDLARIRLKALKLIVWGAVLFAMANLMQQLVYGRFGLATLDEAIVNAGAGKPAAAAVAWVVLMISFFHHLLIFGAIQHSITSTIRMVGYDIPRGMARPLTARSIAEFWGRYLFYFKELLADFFFYPTFTRCFKKYARLRIAFAIFMAAGIGNVLFDVITRVPAIPIQGLWATVADFQSYVVYASLLAIGLILSQMYEKPTSAADGWLRHDFLPRLRVILFFALLLIFDSSTDDITLIERLRFLASLFGG